jgi:serine/threonine-protein kinase
MTEIDDKELPVAPGQIVADKYSISRVIGQGGMGTVVEAKHLELGERVAIKFLRKGEAASAERFIREARAAAKIRSEHVIRIFDVGRLPSGDPYIVMEYLEGEDLGSYIDREGMMSARRLVDIVLGVCEALAEAHVAGIIHRDLKPANIFLAHRAGGDTIVKLLDFGIAKMPEVNTTTTTQGFLGSPVYMSPEQLVAARDVDARSDIWSLGIVLYELLAGTVPFVADSIVELAIEVRQSDLPPLRKRRPDLPDGLDRVVERCLEKDRAARFPDVAELAEALAPFASASAAANAPRIARVLGKPSRRDETALAPTIPPPHPGAAPASSPAYGTLSAVSTSAPLKTTYPSVVGRRARLLLASVTVAIGLGALGTYLRSPAAPKTIASSSAADVAVASPPESPTESITAPRASTATSPPEAVPAVVQPAPPKPQQQPRPARTVTPQPPKPAESPVATATPPPPAPAPCASVVPSQPTAKRRELDRSTPW